LRPVHYGGLEWAMHLFNEAVGGWMESYRAGEMDTKDALQGMEQLRFELPFLVGGDGLHASVTRYPSG